MRPPKTFQKRRVLDPSWTLNGEYVVPLLPIGHYDVSAEAPGFKTSLETGIELNVNARRAVNFILQIHGRSDEIKVEACLSGRFR